MDDLKEDEAENLVVDHTVLLHPLQKISNLPQNLLPLRPHLHKLYSRLRLFQSTSRHPHPSTNSHLINTNNRHRIKLQLQLQLMHLLLLLHILKHQATRLISLPAMPCPPKSPTHPRRHTKIRNNLLRFSILFFSRGTRFSFL